MHSSSYHILSKTMGSWFWLKREEKIQEIQYLSWSEFKITAGKEEMKQQLFPQRRAKLYCIV